MNPFTFLKQKPERLVITIMIPLILIMYIGLTYLLSLDRASVVVESKDSTWNLSGYDLSKEGVQISGQIEYIPNALLTP